jgi:protein TonB
MKMTTVLYAGFLLLAASAHGQNAASWPCSDDLTKAEGDNHRIRVNVNVTQGMVQKKVLPDVSDLKGTKTKSIIVLKVLIGKDGFVRCADPVQGEPNLFERSVVAAKQWRFQPYLLNGQRIIVETTMEFEFNRNKVSAQ